MPLVFKKNSDSAKFLYQPKERIIQVMNKEDELLVLCENSIVYQSFLSQMFENFQKILNLSDKKINILSFSTNLKLSIFASLYNDNAKDDKVYYYYGNLKLEQKNIETFGARIINIIPGKSFFFFEI